MRWAYTPHSRKGMIDMRWESLARRTMKYIQLDNRMQMSELIWASVQPYMSLHARNGVFVACDMDWGTGSILQRKLKGIRNTLLQLDFLEYTSLRFYMGLENTTNPSHLLKIQ